MKNYGTIEQNISGLSKTTIDAEKGGYEKKEKVRANEALFNQVIQPLNQAIPHDDKTCQRAQGKAHRNELLII